VLKRKKYKTVEEYLADFPKEVKAKIQELRTLIKDLAPEAEEGISYNMPGYKLSGKPLVYFAGYEHHIGFYPLPSAIREFKEEISKYKTSKGAIQFPLDKKIPIALVRKILKMRINENNERQKAKKK
jgi:uncharacterized protein YdhG (YjbR/CyaY superfamily)